MSLSNAYVPDSIPETELAVFEKGGYGERVGWGRSPAIVVVDVTNQFVQDDYALGSSAATPSLLEENERILTTARANDLPVFFTRGPGDEPTADVAMKRRKGGSSYEIGDANEIHRDLQPTDDEVVIEKPKPSAFFDTHLAAMLAHHGVDTVVVTGVSTSGCVRATVVDASSHNFHTIVPIECVADRAPTSHEVALFEMDMKYADVTPVDDVLASLEREA